MTASKDIYEVYEVQSKRIVELEAMLSERDKELAEIKEQWQWSDEWVSVDVRLPKDYEPIHFSRRGRVHTGRRDPNNEPLMGAWEDYDGFYSDVTHWMPLPKPPECHGMNGAADE